MIASHPGVVYLSEPFNTQDMIGVPGRNYFPHVTEGVEDAFRQYLEPLLNFRAAPRLRARAGGLANSLWSWPRAALWSLRLLRRRLFACRPLMKDPTAFFSAEWLCEKMGLDAVVLIRHPAAFASSLKRLGWAFDFNDFLSQPELMEIHLSAFHYEIVLFAHRRHEIVDRAVLLWRIFHTVIRRHQEVHPEWIYARHEDLSRRPVAEFARVFRRLGLRLYPHTRRTIEEYSAPENPPEADAGVVHQLRRNSRANIWSWKSRLSADEISRVRRGTEDLADHFYRDDEW